MILLEVGFVIKLPFSSSQMLACPKYHFPKKCHNVESLRFYNIKHLIVIICPTEGNYIKK